MPKQGKFQFILNVDKQQDLREINPRLHSLSKVEPNREDDDEHRHLEKVNFHEEDTAPTVRDCFLQIWELDKYARTSDYLEGEETDLSQRENRLLATIPGVVVQLKKGSFRFRITADPILEHPRNEQMGSILLRLQRVGSSTPEDFEIHLGEYEPTFELAGVLKINANDRSFADFTRNKPHLVHNAKASLVHQLTHRGGFSIAFVADYGPNLSTNNEVFHRQAEQMLGTMATFKVEAGELKLGYYLISNFTEIPAKLEEVRISVQKFLNLSDKPKVGTFEIYAHGFKRGMHFAAKGVDAPGSLRRPHIPEFVRSIAEHLSDIVVFPLFSCSTGRGGKGGKNSIFTTQERSLKEATNEIYGRPFPGEEMGNDSLAWLLFRHLVEEGITNPTVWAHTIPAHATRNTFLRVFSTFGSADFINILYQIPKVSESTASRYRADMAQVITKKKKKKNGKEEVEKPVELTEEQKKKKKEKILLQLHRANFMRPVHLIHAMYVPWAWNGGIDATNATPGFSLELQEEANLLLEEIRSIVPAPDAPEVEDFVFDENRTHILQLREGLSDAKISEDFTFNDFSQHSNAFPLNLKAVRHLQILSYRYKQIKVSIEAILTSNEEGTVGFRLQPVPNTPTNRNTILTTAREMIQDRLFFVRAEIVGKEIEVSA